MGRPRMDPEDSIRGEVLRRLTTYSLQEKCIPNMHAFYENVFSKEYPMPFGTFRWHWNELFRDGLLLKDPKTGALKVKTIDIVDRDKPD